MNAAFVYQKFFNPNHFFPVLIASVVLSHFLFIWADVPELKNTSDVADEAWWAAPAHLKFQTNNWFLFENSGGFLLSPAYNPLVYAWFSVFGSGIVSLRVFHLVFFIVSVVFFFCLLKKQQYPLYGLAILLFVLNGYLFAFRRIGFPENIQFALFFAHLYSLPFKRQHYSILQAIFSGFIVAVLIGIKVSFLLFLPAMVGLWTFLVYKKVLPFRQFFIIGLASLLPLMIGYNLFSENVFASFLPQKNWMNRIFPGHDSLLSPLRILMWLSHFIQTDFFRQPSVSMLVIATLFSLRYLSFKSLTVFQQSILVLSVLWATCTLFSDGSPRRLVFLIPFIGMIPLMIFQSNDEVSTQGKGLWIVVNALLIANLIFWVFTHTGKPNLPLWWTMILVIGLSFTASTRLQNHTWFSYGLFFLFAMVYSFLSFKTETGMLAMVVWIAVSLLALLWVKETKPVVLILLLVSLIVNTFLLLGYISKPHFSYKTALNEMAKQVSGKKIAGSNLAFSLALEANAIPLFHSIIEEGYQPFYERAIANADYYIHNYPLNTNSADELMLIQTLIMQRKAVTETYRDTIWTHTPQPELLIMYRLEGY